MRITLFSLSIILYAALFVLLDRWNLPKPGTEAIYYLDDVTFVLFLALVIHLLFLLPEKSRNVLLAVFILLSRMRRIVLYVFVLLIQMFMVGEWWHYEFYRDYIHYASLGYISDWEEISRGITGFEGRYVALLVSVVLLLLLYGLEKMWQRHTPARKQVFMVSVVLAALCFSGFMYYTRLYKQATQESWQTSGHIPLAVKNPLLSLLREKFIDRNELAIITPEHRQALRNVYGGEVAASDNATTSPFHRNVIADSNAAPQQKLNVIFIVLESFRRYEVGMHNGYTLTPNFDHIAQESFSPEYVYANSNQTIKGEIAVLCGLHDFMIGTSISAYDIQPGTTCLPQLLAANGYDTIWFHGGYKNFYNRSSFMPKMGFKSIVDRKIIEDYLYAHDQKYFIRHWGIEDPYVYKYALDELASHKQPFFAEIMSLSAHHPFFDIENRWDINNFPPQIHGDMNNTYRKYQHAIYYTDRALGEFWKQFRASSLYDNTIVVIVGDHGIWLFPDGAEQNSMDPKLYEMYTRLPLAIHFPKQRPVNTIATPLSQTDIPELVAAYLGVDQGANFQSKLSHADALSLINGHDLDKNYANPVFATIGDNFFYRQGDLRCFPSVASKGNCHDYLYRCVKEHNVMQANRACYRWQGDILYQDVPAQAVDSSNPELDVVVDYFRKSLFARNP